MLPYTVNGMGIGNYEWRDALFLSYRIDPPGLHPCCDGYNAAFSICHALDWKKCNLITTCHNEIRGGFANLVGKTFTPLYMLNNPPIHIGRSMQEGKTHPMGSLLNNLPADKETSEKKFDLMIRYL